MKTGDKVKASNRRQVYSGEGIITKVYPPDGNDERPFYEVQFFENGRNVWSSYFSTELKLIESV